MTTALRLATYNIHRFTGRKGEYSPQRTLQQIDGLQADVVALQEVLADDRQGMVMLAQLARDRGYHLALGSTIVDRPGQHYGNVMLLRGEEIEITRHDLSRPGREPRGAIEAQLSLRGEPWRIFATHLGLSPGERRWQVRYLLQQIERQPDANTALLGDLNEWYLWGRPLRWLKRHFRVARQPPTYPSRWPLLALDRIWIHPAPRLLDIEAIDTPLSRTVSDHLPLVACVAHPP